MMAVVGLVLVLLLLVGNNLYTWVPSEPMYSFKFKYQNTSFNGGSLFVLKS